MTFDDPIKLKDYLEKFYSLLHIFYVSNLLKINSDKTKLIFFNTGTNTSFANNFFFRANNDIIKPKSNITILGFVLSSNLSTDNHINTIIPSLHHRINTIRLVQNVTDEKTCLQLANSIVIVK